MSTLYALLAGILSGTLMGWVIGFGHRLEPSIPIHNGLLKGWVITTDHEALVCTDPIVFIHAKQIECP